MEMRAPSIDEVDEEYLVDVVPGWLSAYTSAANITADHTCSKN